MKKPEIVNLVLKEPLTREKLEEFSLARAMSPIAKQALKIRMSGDPRGLKIPLMINGRTRPDRDELVKAAAWCLVQIRLWDKVMANKEGDGEKT